MLEISSVPSPPGLLRPSFRVGRWLCVMRQTKQGRPALVSSFQLLQLHSLWKFLQGSLWHLNRLSVRPGFLHCHEFSSYSNSWQCDVIHLILCLYCSVAQLCLTLCNPRDCSTPGLPVHHHLPKFAHISCLLRRWWCPAISSSDALFSFCPQSFPDLSMLF